MGKEWDNRNNDFDFRWESIECWVEINIASFVAAEKCASLKSTKET
jgi:hypothetical protein